MAAPTLPLEEFQPEVNCNSRVCLLLDSGQMSREVKSPFRSSRTGARVRALTALVILDALSIVAAFVVANLLRAGDVLYSSGLETLLILLPTYLVVSSGYRSYSDDVLCDAKMGLKRAVKSLALSIALVIGIIFYLKAGATFSRLIMGVGSATSLLFLSLARWAAGKYLCNISFTNEVIFADGVTVVPTGGELVLFAEQAELQPSLRDPALFDRLARLLQNCDRVVLACSSEKRAAWVVMMRGLGIKVELLAPELDAIDALGMGRLGQHTTLTVSRGPFSFGQRLTKRSFDLFVAVATLTILSPLFLAIAIAIKFDSEGPVFFRQRRMGRSNRVFQILKFRSMASELADGDGVRSASRDDDRLTRVGAFLRRTSLDELPQLINVLRGEMSIVGPRPHALGSTAEEDFFWDIDARYWLRHTIQPGITGLAQVRGFRGATQYRSDLLHRLQADLEYMRGWSLWRDIRILVATARVLFHKNAY